MAESSGFVNHSWQNTKITNGFVNHSRHSIKSEWFRKPSQTRYHAQDGFVNHSRHSIKSKWFRKPLAEHQARNGLRNHHLNNKAVCANRNGCKEITYATT